MFGLCMCALLKLIKVFLHCNFISMTLIVHLGEKQTNPKKMVLFCINKHYHISSISLAQNCLILQSIALRYYILEN